MAKGYVIFTEVVNDLDRLNQYARAATPSVIQYGGKALVVDDSAEALEGEWHGSRTVVLEFESVDAARSWYQSPEYQAVVAERHAAAVSNGVIVSGL
jgi:uncharacterized protein (DUF1330 family)